VAHKQWQARFADANRKGSKWDYPSATLRQVVYKNRAICFFMENKQCKTYWNPWLEKNTI
jgi:hypothetical protein